MPTLVLLRHGESTWNRDNLFTGWVDVPLSEKGRTEAVQAGELLKDARLLPDVVHTSVLVRAIDTANIALDTCSRAWIPVRRSWRLNERHYGALQGLNKKETADRYGQDQVFAWRRSYDVRPPELERDDPSHPRFDPRYEDVPENELPAAECLADVVARMTPYWNDGIIPDLTGDRCVLISAHGNSLRALIKTLEDISDADIADFNVPTGIPRVYELGSNLSVTSVGYLGDADAAAKAAESVARQAG